MLGNCGIVAYAATADSVSAKRFYAEILGLTFVHEDDFALVFEANGTPLRIQKLTKFVPQAHTLLGWTVADIADTVRRLASNGLAFENYGFPGQDPSGIWPSPSGAKIAWFKDPDGNVLSLTEPAA